MLAPVCAGGGGAAAAAAVFNSQPALAPSCFAEADELDQHIQRVCYEPVLY